LSPHWPWSMFPPGRCAKFSNKSLKFLFFIVFSCTKLHFAGDIPWTPGPG
jgi:hypothetical protein